MTDVRQALVIISSLDVGDITGMPIYMDRHHNVDFTPEAVAEAQRTDLEHAHEHGVDFKTYWFDKERKRVFCLAEAPGIEAVKTVHNIAHGLQCAETD